MLGLIETTFGKPQITDLGGTDLVRVEDVTVPLDENFKAPLLLFTPRAAAPRAAVIAVPSANESREQFAGIVEGMAPARWLTALLDRGVAVGVPTTIERRMDHPLCQRLHLDRRRLLHRLGFIVGRTLTGLEVQQVLGLRTFLASHVGVPADRIGILGERQGGMTALYAAAIDEKVGALSILNYFQQREACWKEPVDRMLYGQLNEFGDAEVAALIAPRPLTVLYTAEGPTPPTSVEAEAVRARRFYDGLRQTSALIVKEVQASHALEACALAIAETLEATEKTEVPPLTLRIPAEQIERTRNDHFEALHLYLRHLYAESDKIRKRHWQLLSTGPSERTQVVSRLHTELSELMGIIPTGNGSLNPRTKLIKVTDAFIAYDVLLDVVPGVEAYGQLLIPKKVETRLPVVICQHGNGGAPKDVTGIVEPWINFSLDHSGKKVQTIYHAFAVRLAERGYVTFAPYVCVPNPAGVPEGATVNPLVRQAAAIGKMRTSIELTKLHRIIDFLQGLPFVDPERIGYYGLSYGGYDAIWMPPLEPRIKADVISGNFNDWREKITNEVQPTSYMFHEDEDFYNWDVLNVFTHLELIASMWPRPVCVEWGVHDPVTPPDWHWQAWAQVESLIQSWNLDHVRDVVFNGPHEIHGVETFEFLDTFLRKPASASSD